jgi:predicted glycosyltransferase
VKLKNKIVHVKRKSYILQQSRSISVKLSFNKTLNSLARGLYKKERCVLSIMDIMQQLMDVDKKAREQERMELIQRFYNEGVSITTIANATNMCEEDISYIVSN